MKKVDRQGGLDNMEGDHSNFIDDINTMAYSVIKLPIIDTHH